MRTKFDSAVAIHCELQELEFDPFVELFQETTLGSVYFLPSIEMSEFESASIIIGDLLGVKNLTQAPGWVDKIIVPDQSEIDCQIESNSLNIAQLNAESQQLSVNRTYLRRFLKLLYEKGINLEDIVLESLTILGAEVERPDLVANKEDGWLKVYIEGKEYNGVLEIKSTEKQQHNVKGIRQLGEWKTKGINEKGIKYKAIFIVTMRSHTLTVIFYKDYTKFITQFGNAPHIRH